MSSGNTIAGYPVVGYGLGYPIVRAGDGQLYYYDHTDKKGDSFGWKVGTPDPRRHHHAHHVHAKQSSHLAHHHAVSHSTHRHSAAASVNNRRAVSPPPHHLANAAPALRAETGNRIVVSPGKAIAPVAESESGSWAGKLEGFEKRHLRLILGVQGGLDIMAGPATIATTVTIALALAPETGGLSLLLAGAALVYGVTRGGVQTAAGMAELAAAAGGNKEQEESVKDGMEHVKTLTSISGFLILGTQQARHGTITKDDWNHAGFASDAETLITGRGVDRAFEEASEAVRISSRVASMLKWGGYADKTDQAHSVTKDSLSAADWAQKLIEQQNRDRKKKALQRQAAPSTPQKSAN